MLSTEKKSQLLNGNVFVGEDYKIITVNGLFELLQTIKGSTFVSFQYANTEKKCATKTPLNTLNFTTCNIGVDYLTKGNRRVEEENQLTTEELKSAPYEKITNTVGLLRGNKKPCLIYQTESTAQTTKIWFDTDNNLVSEPMFYYTDTNFIESAVKFFNSFETLNDFNEKQNKLNRIFEHVENIQPKGQAKAKIELFKNAIAELKTELQAVNLLDNQIIDKIKLFAQTFTKEETTALQGRLNSEDNFNQNCISLDKLTYIKINKQVYKIEQ